MATKSKRAARESVAVRAAWYSELGDDSDSHDDEEDDSPEDEADGDESDEKEPQEIEELRCQSDGETYVQADAETDVLPPIRLRMSRYACLNGFLFLFHSVQT